MKTSMRCAIPGFIPVLFFIGAMAGCATKPDALDKAHMLVKPNVLMFAVDDLRPELGCYGVKRVHSPNIDRLATGGMLFERACCQQAVCSPSRTSLMTGLRPDSTRVYDLATHFRNTVPDVVTLTEQFIKHGYRSVGLGKIYHGSLNDEQSWHSYDACHGPMWVQPENQQIVERRRAEAKKKKLIGRNFWRACLGPPVEIGLQNTDQYSDTVLTRQAIAQLRALKKNEKPFFLAIGYRRPHLPFNAPKKFWDLYDRSKIELSPITDWPKGSPGFSRTNWGELRNYHGIPEQGNVTDEQAVELIHGYLAAVSYIDDGIGQVLAELDRLDLADNTIVVLWGDHGWKLSEYSAWCKHTNYHIDTHVPLIVRYPGMRNRGRRSEALVEYVDIYPTLCELAGLPIPEHTEGTSMVPLLRDPDRAWKSAAFSQYPRRNLMGYSMRTDRYHLVLWINRGDPTRPTEAVELYDLKDDPHETVNLAADAGHAELVKKLEAQCRAGWKAAKSGG